MLLIIIISILTLILILIICANIATIIVMRRKRSRKKRIKFCKSENHFNMEFNENDRNYLELIDNTLYNNYDIGVYEEINYNELDVEINQSVENTEYQQ